MIFFVWLPSFHRRIFFSFYLFPLMIIVLFIFQGFFFFLYCLNFCFTWNKLQNSLTKLPWLTKVKGMWNVCREMSHSLVYLPCHLRAKLSQSNIYCSSTLLYSRVCCFSVTSPWSLRAEEATFKTCLAGPEIVILSDTECLGGYWLLWKKNTSQKGPSPR